MKARVLILLIAFALATPVSGAVIGQIDTFEDGTTMGWFVPGASPFPPMNIDTGGPAGIGDAYLLLQASGFDAPGGRLSVLNDAQWSGDYLSAGITAIRMDVYNFGPSDLYLRLLFEDFAGPGPPANLALSALPVFVPAGSGWLTVVFGVSPSDLVPGEFGTVLGALMSTDVVRIFHNPDPTFPGPGVGIPPVQAALGVDNITATGVPEPGTTSLLAIGLVGLALLRKRL
jgi:hypothetical protein